MGNTMTSAAVYDLARSTGLSADQATIATAIAWAESGLDATAVGDEGIQTSKWGPSYGLWQIRSLKADLGTGHTRDGALLTNPAFNARSMHEISSGGTDWSAWSTYTSGKYREHLGQTSTAGTSTDIAGDPIDARSPLEQQFAGWQEDATRIGLTVTVAGVALVLLVLGIKSTVSGPQ